MKEAEYKTYVADVENFLQRNHAKPGCHGSAKEGAEPFFSWSPCECCGSPLGGNRETYNFVCEDGTVFAADICADCVYFLAYGTLDDETMKEVKNL